MRSALALLAMLAPLAGCTTLPAYAPDGLKIASYQPAPGSNVVLEGPIEGAPDRHLVMGDLVAAPGSVIPRHYHSGEEFLYVIGGSAILKREGMPDMELRPGQSVRIAPGVVHGGISGPDGTRAISSWIVVNNQPLRTLAPE